MTNEGGRDMIEPDGPSVVSKDDDESKVSTWIISRKSEMSNRTFPTHSAHPQENVMKKRLT